MNIHKIGSDTDSVEDFDAIDKINDYFAVFDQFDRVMIGNSPYKMEGLLFILCTAGKMEIGINLIDYRISAGDIAIILPGQILQYKEHSADFSGKCIYMSTRLLSDAGTRTMRHGDISDFFTLRDNPCMPVDNDMIHLFHEYFSFLRERVRNPADKMKKEIIQNLVGAFFMEMTSFYGEYLPKNNKKLSRKDEICKNFMSLLMKHYKDSRSVSFYADKLFLTPKYLSATLKAVTGKKAGQLINDYVLLQAKVLLRSSDMTIQQISEELNFANQSFFGRYFKQLTGMAPTKYRNS